MARPKGIKSKKSTKAKMKCQGKCQREVVDSNFYDTKSPMFPSGKVPICKKCLKEMVNYDDINTVYQVLQSIDVPFFYDVWEGCIAKKDNREPLGNYIRMANSGINQFDGTRWKDSVFNEEGSKTEKDYTKEVPKETVYSDIWRGTYTKSDIEYLDNYFKDLKRDFKIVTRNHIDYARKIAKASLAMDRAYEDMINGTGTETKYGKLKEVFDSLSKSAQFSEDKRGANDVSLGSFGVVFELVEKKQWIPKHTPLEKDDIDKLIDSFATINKSL